MTENKLSTEERLREENVQDIHSLIKGLQQ